MEINIQIQPFNSCIKYDKIVWDWILKFDYRVPDCRLNYQILYIDIHYVYYLLIHVYVEFIFVSHIRTFIKNYLLLIVISIVDLSEFKCAKDTNPTMCTSPREFWGARAPIWEEFWFGIKPKEQVMGLWAIKHLVLFRLFCVFSFRCLLDLGNIS